MQISSRFTIALHILCCIAVFGDTETVTSEYLASSIGVNPVMIRRIIQQLKAADLIDVKRGSGGASFHRPAEEISLYDVYEAVNCVDNGQLFHFHNMPNPSCPVGRNIHDVLDGRLSHAQQAMEDDLRSMTVAKAIADLQEDIEKDKEKREKKMRF